MVEVTMIDQISKIAKFGNYLNTGVLCHFLGIAQPQGGCESFSPFLTPIL